MLNFMPVKGFMQALKIHSNRPAVLGAVYDYWKAKVSFSFLSRGLSWNVISCSQS